MGTDYPAGNWHMASVAQARPSLRSAPISFEVELLEIL